MLVSTRLMNCVIDDHYVICLHHLGIIQLHLLDVISMCNSYLSGSGIGMLLNQGVPGFEAWFGIRPVVDAEIETLVTG